MEEIEKLKKYISDARKIVVFTGAGMSTESGIPDFRSTNGVYSQFDNVEDYISSYYFKKKPKEFWRIYKDVFSIKLMGQYQPNSGHHFITELQESGKDITVLTQNIDGLHTESGTKDVIELHGTLKNATCLNCGTVYNLNHILREETPMCRKKNCQIVLKPDVVLFGDMVKNFQVALNKAYESDLFIVMGSSLEVYPVNQIPQYIKRTNIPMVVINKGKTKLDYLFDLKINDRIGNVVRKLKNTP